MTTMRQIEGPVTFTQDPDTFDVRGALLSLYRTALLEWRVIAVTTAVVLAVAIAYAIWWPPIYQAEATVMSEGDHDTARDAFYGGWSVFRKDDMRTEAELFTSAPVLKEVIKREKLTYDDIYHPFGSHIAYLWQKSFVGRTYHRFKEWISPPDADAPTPEEQDKSRTLADMKAGIFLAPVGEANMGILTVRGPSRRVADIANTLVHVYLEQRIERYRTESVDSVKTLNAAAASVAAALHAVEQERIDFMRKNGLGIGVDKEKAEVQKIADLEEREADTRSKIAAHEASLAELRREINAEPATRTITTSYELNAQREAMKQKRLEQQALLVYSRTRYREDSPEVQDILKTIAGLDTIIAETAEKVPKASTDALNSAREELRTRENGLNSELAGLRAALGAMERYHAQLQARMAKVPALQAKLRDYDREYKFAEDKYLNVDGKRAQAALSITSLGAMPSTRIVAEAVRPDNKYWPRNYILYPVALLGGLVLGLAVALVKSIILGRVRREHLQQGRGAAPFYGLVAVPAKPPRLSVVMPDRLAPPASS